jgi:hypothetical protein
MRKSYRANKRMRTNDFIFRYAKNGDAFACRARSENGDFSFENSHDDMRKGAYAESDKPSAKRFVFNCMPDR